MGLEAGLLPDPASPIAQAGCFSFFLLSDFCCKDFNSMLNESGKSGHSCLIPDLRGKNFTIEYDVNYEFVINGLYCVEMCSHYTKFVESFYHRYMFNFVKSFWCIY